MGKYVVPTGEGYLGVAAVGANRSAGFGVGLWPVEWDGNTEVYAIAEEPGVAIVEMDRRPNEYITIYQVSVPWSGKVGPSLSVAGAVLNVLGVDTGDEIRAYERETGGVLLVPADPDPFVEGDDG